MTDPVLAAYPPEAQATSRAPVLLPALLPEPFDYATPEGLLPGTLVEAPLAGRKLVGVVWPEPAAPAKAGKHYALKPVNRVLDYVPPLGEPLLKFLSWMAGFTLAPKGAVLSLCGLAYAAKLPKKPQPPQTFTLALPHLTDAQQQVAAQLNGTKPILLDGVTGSGKTEVYFHAMAEAIGEGKQVLVLLPEIALTHQWLARFEKTFGAKPCVWHSRMTPVAKARAWQAVARGTIQVVVGARSALFLPFAQLGLIVVDEEHDPSYKQEDGVLYHARDMAVVRAHFEQVPIILASATPSLETMENVREGKYRALTLPERFGKAGLPSVRLIDMRNDPPERGDFLSPTVKKELLETLARGEQVLLFLNRRGYAPLLLCRACGHRFECNNCSAWLTLHGGRGSRVASHGEPPRSAKYQLQCHHCDHREPMPNTCPSCNADQAMLAPCGPGVERIADEVRAMFSSSHLRGQAGRGALDAHRKGHPLETTVTHAKTLRKDMTDAVLGRIEEALQQASPHPNPPPEGEGTTPTLAVLSSDEAIAAETWEAIEAGEIDILVGTQMVAKGHHFPRLTYVAVVDADVGLSGADLRAGERTYQLLHQLSGRAGRGELAGSVSIQTYLPDHPVMEALAAGDRNRLMQLEAGERRAGGWPPFGQLAAILLDGVDEMKVKQAGQLLARSAPDDSRLTVLGPAPAPLSKLRGQFRYRLLVKAKDGIHLQRTLRAWLDGQKFSGVRVKVDVNPYYFL